MQKEQHPIDKIFVRKLEEMEGSPSAQSWDRLEKRLGQKKARKKGIIWLSYASAAAVVLLLGSLWLLAGRETEPVTPEIAVRNDNRQETVKSNPPVENGAVAQSTPTPKATRQLPAAEPEPKISPRHVPAKQETAERLAATKAPRKPKLTPKAASANQPDRQEEVPVITAPIEEQITRNTDTSPALRPVDKLPEPEEQTLVVVVQVPERSVDAAWEDAADAPEPGPAPRTRTGRLLEGLKKVKHGEFRELGLTPDHLLARFREKEKADR
jgi:hypothetical protein